MSVQIIGGNPLRNFKLPDDPNDRERFMRLHHRIVDKAIREEHKFWMIIICTPTLLAILYSIFIAIDPYIK